MGEVEWAALKQRAFGRFPRLADWIDRLWLALVRSTEGHLVSAWCAIRERLQKEGA